LGVSLQKRISGVNLQH